VRDCIFRPENVIFIALWQERKKMQISSRFVGSQCRPLEIEVTPRMSMNYAASVDDANPRYFDDERADGLVAPPMMANSLTWGISSEVEKHWDSEGFPVDVMRQKVHYLEILECHRCIVPGETIRIEGTLVAMLPHRAGTHMVIRYDGYDRNRHLVFVEYAGALLRNVECLDGGQGAGSIPAAPERAPKGAPVWERTLYIAPLACHRFDGCANVHFPIHTSPAFAHFVGLPGTIYHGVATLSVAMREIANIEAGGDPARIRAIRCNFTGMVRPDSHIKVCALGKSERDGLTHVHFNVLNEEGQRAIHKGCVTLS